MTLTADQEFHVNSNGSIGDPNDKCIPRFFYRAKLMEVKTKEAGRPIMEQELMVEIIIPGQKSPVTRKMIDADKERWPMQWFKFEKMGDAKIEGTPIEEWPQLTVMQIGMLKSINVLSIEALSTLDDSHLFKLGPDARALRDKAKRFLDMSKDNALVEKQAARIDELEKMIRDIQAKQPVSIIPTADKPKRKYTKKATA